MSPQAGSSKNPVSPMGKCIKYRIIDSLELILVLEFCMLLINMWFVTII
jgi:hypothetical protein